jgi:hypothetical protein
MFSANLKLESKNLTCSMYSVHCGGGGEGFMSNSGTLASNRQNTVSPKYNDISLLILQYLIPDDLHLSVNNYNIQRTYIVGLVNSCLIRLYVRHPIRNLIHIYILCIYF